MKIHIALITCVLGFLSFCTNAKVKLDIALTHIPSVLEFENKTAPYNRLIQFVETELSNEFDLTFAYMPSSRSNKKLIDQTIDCIFPIVPTDLRRIKTQLSVPVNRISAYIFTLAPEVITDLTILHNKVVVHQRGYLFGDFLAEHQDINFFPVANHAAALGMMQKKRAAAYIDYIPDLRFVLTEQQFALLTYDKTKPLVQSYDHFECRTTQNSDQFIKRVNHLLIELKKNGKLEALLGKYFVATESY